MRNCKWATSTRRRRCSAIWKFVLPRTDATARKNCSLYCFHWQTTGFSGKPFNFCSPVDTIPPPSTLAKEAYTRCSGREDFAFPTTVICVRKNALTGLRTAALLHTLRSIACSCFCHYERIIAVQTHTYGRFMVITVFLIYNNDSQATMQRNPID
mgnify:CR=1 FL=1